MKGVQEIEDQFAPVPRTHEGSYRNHTDSTVMQQTPASVQQGDKILQQGDGSTYDHSYVAPGRPCRTLELPATGSAAGQLSADKGSHRGIDSSVGAGSVPLSMRESQQISRMLSSSWEELLGGELVSASSSADGTQLGALKDPHDLNRLLEQRGHSCALESQWRGYAAAAVLPWKQPERKAVSTAQRFFVLVSTGTT